MLSALIFLDLTIFERIFSISLGFMSLGLGDVFIIGFLAFNIFGSKKLDIDKNIFILTISIFISILLSVIYNGSYFGLNSLLTIPAKLIVGAIIASQMLTAKIDRRHILLIDINILVFLFIEVFLSDASPFFNLDLFNRNETLAYISCLFCLRATCIYLGNFGKFRITSQVLVPFLVLFICALVVQSRQASMAAIAFVISFYLLNSINKIIFFRRVALISGLFAILISIFLTIEISGYAGTRIQTLQTFEPSNRADKQRLANIVQSYEGFKESPILGKGPTSFIRNNPYNKVAHNTYASTLYELGLLGIFVLFLIFKKLLSSVFIKTYDERTRLFSKLIGAFSIFFMFQSIFIESLPKAPLYIILTCCICLLKRVKSRPINNTNMIHE